MKTSIKIIATFLSLIFVYTAQAAPGKTFFYKDETKAANTIKYATKSPVEIPVKSGWVKKEVALSWQTITEVNTIYFELQRSFDGKDYKTIKTITASGNSKNVINYSFIDDSNENRRGQSYYRLKAVFANGEEIVSEGAKTKKTGVFDMNQSYAAAAGMVATK